MLIRSILIWSLTAVVTLTAVGQSGPTNPPSPTAPAPWKDRWRSLQFPTPEADSRVTVKHDPETGQTNFKTVLKTPTHELEFTCSETGNVSHPASPPEFLNFVVRPLGSDGYIEGEVVFLAGKDWKQTTRVSKPKDLTAPCVFRIATADLLLVAKSTVGRVRVGQTGFEFTEAEFTQLRNFLGTLTPSATPASPPVAPAPQPLATPPATVTPKPAAPAAESPMVFATRSGAKYHRSSCQYVRKSGYSLTLDEAKKKGLSPCSKCNPPG